MELLDNLTKACFGAINRLVVGRPKIELVELVIAGAGRVAGQHDRREPGRVVAREEEIGHSQLEVLPRVLEPLEHDLIGARDWGEPGDREDREG